jgi:outer membrane protein
MGRLAPRDASFAGARAGNAAFEATRQQLAVRVAQAYLDVLRASDTLDTLKAEEASTRREQQAAQARFDAGRAKITDVREAQARGWHRRAHRDRKRATGHGCRQVPRTDRP